MHEKYFYKARQKCKLIHMAGLRAYHNFSESGQLPQAGCRIALSADESRHLCGSLRARSGEAVDVFDLSGTVFRCRIAEASQRACSVEVVSRVEVCGSGTRVYLAQCLPKGRVFDEIVRQCVELGAAGIIPIVSERSVFRSAAEDMAGKFSKWRARVIEAVKQSANFIKFDIRAPRSLGDFFDSCGEFDLRIVASLEPGALPILGALGNALGGGAPAEKACILVGPEGDLSASEYARARQNSFLPVKLGENVMKCDTAAVCAVGVARAFFGNVPA